MKPSDKDVINRITNFGLFGVDVNRDNALRQDVFRNGQGQAYYNNKPISDEDFIQLQEERFHLYQQGKKPEYGRK